MNTLRHYFVARDLEAVEQLETDLRDAGIGRAQLGVLTQDTVGAEQRGLALVSSLFKRDLVRCLARGALVGLLLATSVIAAVAILGLSGPVLGWTPFVFLAIVAFGFCTWEGGLIGIEEPNRMAKMFASDVQAGRHVFFVDLTPDQNQALLTGMENTPEIDFERLDVGKPGWMVAFYNWLVRFVDRNLASQSDSAR